MRITVASGKGGAGKTSVAVSLALAAGEGSLLVDCDVEEPNAALLLGVTAKEAEKATIPVPQVKEEACTFCKECSKACRFHAIMILPHKAVVFEKMCHGCGVCSFVCPENAIVEVPREIGRIGKATARKGIRLLEGRLNVGEAMAPPLIRQVKSRIGQEELVILDAPPGVSCPFVETAKGSDFILFVVEPTPFGYHDFELSSRVVGELGSRWGVLVNKWVDGETGDVVERIESVCRKRGGIMLGSVPFSMAVAKGYSEGRPMIEVEPGLRPLFAEILKRIQGLSQDRRETK